jgi:hypothetical protein
MLSVGYLRSCDGHERLGTAIRGPVVFVAGVRHGGMSCDKCAGINSDSREARNG